MDFATTLANARVCLARTDHCRIRLSRAILTVVTAIADQRSLIQPLLDERAPADAFTAYYALHHDPRRSVIFLHHDRENRVDGFLARAQTGLDLFRPVVVLRAAFDQAAIDLFRSGLSPNRPYYMVAPIALADAVNRSLQVSDAEVLCIYRLDPGIFVPHINVLVVSNPTPEGAPRYEIASQGTVQAMAGVNWRSPRFAEVYVYTEPAARGRGWGKAVVSALVADLLKNNLIPLYVVNQQNAPSINLATSVGFVDTHAREYAGQAVLSL
jgi:GNAT superfamily N-acetyltransferase